MFQLVRRLRSDRRGQALVEYALLACLVGACFVAILGLVGDAVKGSYRRSVAGLSGAEGSHGSGGGGSVGSVGGGGSAGSTGGWSASTVSHSSPSPPPESPPDSSAVDSTGATDPDSSATEW